MPPRRHYNLSAYRFKDTRGLRAALRHIDSWQYVEDVNAVVIIVDLLDALEHPDVLTARQKETLRLNLIQGLSIKEVASKTGAQPRTVSGTVKTGLRRLLGYLQTGELPRPNQHDSWSAEDLAYLKAHLGDPRASIAAALGRTLPAIYQAISNLRNDGLLATPRKSGRPVHPNFGRRRETAGVSHSNAGPA